MAGGGLGRQDPDGAAGPAAARSWSEAFRPCWASLSPESTKPLSHPQGPAPLWLRLGPGRVAAWKPGRFYTGPLPAIQHSVTTSPPRNALLGQRIPRARGDSSTGCRGRSPMHICGFAHSPSPREHVLLRAGTWQPAGTVSRDSTECRSLHSPLLPNRCVSVNCTKCDCL